MLKVNNNYFIQTPTHYYTGKLLEIKENGLVFEQGAWIADTGRFSNCFQTGEFNEVEPFPGQFFIPKNAIICIIEWSKALPTTQK